MSAPWFCTSINLHHGWVGPWLVQDARRADQGSGLFPWRDWESLATWWGRCSLDEWMVDGYRVLCNMIVESSNTHIIFTTICVLIVDGWLIIENYQYISYIPWMIDGWWLVGNRSGRIPSSIGITSAKRPTPACLGRISRARLRSLEGTIRHFSWRHSFSRC
jgi:hypothetical protein